MNYTQNYQLPQWEKTDRIMMDDFNNAFGRLETALNGKCHLLVGTYQGNGKDNRFIDLGKTPLAVLLCDENSNMRDGSYTFGGIATQGSATLGLSITEGGFTVRESGNVNCNFISNGYPRTYRYIALFG